MPKCLRCGAGSEWIEGRVKLRELSLHEFETLLIRHGLVDVRAVEDAAGYDGGAIQRAVASAYRDLVG